MSEYEINKEIAAQICRDLEFDGRRFELGACVALLDGQVVSVNATLDEALRHLRSIEPRPERGMVLEVVPPTIDLIIHRDECGYDRRMRLQRRASIRRFPQ